jgi:hypothetical protein
MPKPQRVIARRAPSFPTRHNDVTLTICEARLTLRVSPSAIRGYEALVLYRCEACDIEAFADHRSAPAVQMFGVLPDAFQYWEDGWWGDADADDGDQAYGV